MRLCFALSLLFAMVPSSRILGDATSHVRGKVPRPVHSQSLSHGLDLASVSYQKSEPSEDPLQVKMHYLDESVPSGGNSLLLIDLDIAPGYKAYLDMFKIDWKIPGGVVSGKIKTDKTVNFFDKFSKRNREGIMGLARLTVAFEVSAQTPSKNYDSKIDFRFQICTEKRCLFPKIKTVELPLTVVSTGASLSPSTPESIAPSALSLALQKGRLYTFLFVFLAGVLTSLTPCIFPMIPITMAIIGARASQNRYRSILLSFCYVLGIALTYSILGIIAAKTGALFGSMLGNPVVVTVIAFLFVVMGLSMYGLFEIRLPLALAGRLSRVQTGANYFGAFITGLITGIVASPCVGPVLVSILTFVAQTQDLVFGFFLLFVFAFGMGQIFILLGAFSGLLNRLPKSGSWMEAVKFIFGTIMISAALYYLHPIVTEDIFNILLGVTFVLIAGFFGAFEPNKHLSKFGQVRKAVMLGTFILGIGFALKALHLTPNFSGQETKVERAGAWRGYSSDLISEAQKNQKPVIIDFSAEWCVACKELESDTFRDSEVQSLGDQFYLLKIDATADTEEIQKLKDQYHVVGLPHVVFISSGGKILKDLTLTGFESATLFLKRMKATLEQ